MGDLSDTVAQFWKTIEAGDLDGLAPMLADDVVFEFPGMHLEGPEAVIQMIRGWYAAFPDLNHTTIEGFGSGDHYACRLLIRGTHNGPFVTPNGEIPATGRSVEFASCDYIVGSGGTVSQWYAHPDMAGVLAQIS